ncbi:MAG: cytochrome b/b6 domain-containing protein [Halobacteriales archaeon]
MSNSQGRDLVELVTETIWKPYGEVDERCPQLTGASTVAERVRHSMGTRISHWVQVLLMAVLVVTGYAIWSGVFGPMNYGIWDGYYVAFGLHMWAGIIILAFTLVLFPFYHVFVDGHRALPDLADVILSINVGLAFVGLRDYPPNYHEGRRAWDTRIKHWMVGHPAQKAYFWIISAFLALMALTGFGMYREMALDPAGWVVALGFLAGPLAQETLKQIHFVLGAVMLGMVLFHAYFAVIPSNWDFLRSMVSGRLPVYHVRSGEPPDAAGGDADRATGGGSDDD